MLDRPPGARPKPVIALKSEGKTLPHRTAKSKALLRRARNRRHRARQARGEAIAPVWYTARVLDMLHWLDQRDVGDRQRVGEALGRMADGNGEGLRVLERC